MFIKTFIGGVQRTVSDVFGFPVNPGSPVTGDAILIADNLAAGTHTVALDMTGLKGYYLQYTEATAGATIDVQMRAATSMGYANIGGQKVLTAGWAGFMTVFAEMDQYLATRQVLAPDGQAVITVAATGHCTAWLIPIPA